MAEFHTGIVVSDTTHSERSGTISDANSSVFAPLPKPTIISSYFTPSLVLVARFSTLLSNIPDVPDTRARLYEPHLGVRWNQQQQVYVEDVQVFSDNRTERLSETGGR